MVRASRGSCVVPSRPKPGMLHTWKRGSEKEPKRVTAQTLSPPVFPRPSPFTLVTLTRITLSTLSPTSKGGGRVGKALQAGIPFLTSLFCNLRTGETEGASPDPRECRMVNQVASPTSIQRLLRTFLSANFRFPFRRGWRRGWRWGGRGGGGVATVDGEGQDKTRQHNTTQGKTRQHVTDVVSCQHLALVGVHMGCT
jgi:hypothetical protein